MFKNNTAAIEFVELSVTDEFYDWYMEEVEMGGEFGVPKKEGEVLKEEFFKLVEGIEIEDKDELFELVLTDKFFDWFHSFPEEIVDEEVLRFEFVDSLTELIG